MYGETACRRLEERAKGGIQVGARKMYSLTYADDIVVVAKKMEGMRLMMKEVEGYLDEMGMELNVEKTKLVRFGKRIRGEVRCKWKGGWIEEARVVTYLGYKFGRNGRQDEHIAERVKKAGGIMKEVWGIGKRIYKDDYGRRMCLYEKLVWPVVG
ncbi:uncharacterized protein [Prorops nasuta]|uniref:uncharacterized protein n=1 Tax=Prorops nasuta TaxID=863751 RepID=UPI0034CE54AC